MFPGRFELLGEELPGTILSIIKGAPRHGASNEPCMSSPVDEFEMQGGVSTRNLPDFLENPRGKHWIIYGTQEKGVDPNGSQPGE
jgi:hypothetical protein